MFKVQKNDSQTIQLWNSSQTKRYKQVWHVDLVKEFHKTPCFVHAGIESDDRVFFTYAYQNAATDPKNNVNGTAKK